MKLDHKVSPGTWTRTSALGELENILKKNKDWQSFILHFKEGDLLLEESQAQKRVGIILEGKIELFKQSDSGKALQVDTIGPGDMIGLLSYFTREINLVGVRALAPGRALLQDWESFSAMLHSDSTLEALFAYLMRENLTGRYRRLVGIHLQMAELNRQLDSERSELTATVSELERTRNRLIHQEKLAMLGQVVAGLAHELNNPVAALLRNLDYLEESLKELWVDPTGNTALQKIWKLGRSEPILATRIQRKNTDVLQKDYPNLSNRTIRRLSALPETAIKMALPAPTTEANWEPWIQAFEAGRCLHTLQTSSERIAKMVQSLKNYARPPTESLESVDLQKGILDTLLILSNRFREIEIETRLDSLPPIHGNAGELNQIWTNLLVNACDAMGDSGKMLLQGKVTDEHWIEINFEDSGPGIPEDKLTSIFEPHYTTKSKGGNFGLGLGLSIAREIARQHGGEITAHNHSSNGAVFTVRLPNPPISQIPNSHKAANP